MNSHWIQNIYDTLLFFSMTTKQLIINPEEYVTDKAVEALVLKLKADNVSIRKTVDLLNQKGIKYKEKGLYYSAVQRIIKADFQAKQAEKAETAIENIALQAEKLEEKVADLAENHLEAEAQLPSTEEDGQAPEEGEEENLEETESATTIQRTERVHPRTPRELRNYLRNRR